MWFTLAASGLSQSVRRTAEGALLAVYESGYGVRDVTTGEAVDEHTLFAVGSTSKAFTSAALGMLVDEGRLGWDDRVIDHIPWFEMYDAYATRELTIRDLLTHRSGLARGDAVWSRWPHDRHEIIRRIRYLKPTRSFRGAWQYQNLMFLTAGEVVRVASGQSWDDFVAVGARTGTTTCSGWCRTTRPTGRCS